MEAEPSTNREIRDDVRLIRSIEATVVDEIHRRNRLLKMPQDHALALLLKAYGEACRAQRKMATLADHSASHLMVHGLSHAIRWVLLDCSTGGSMPGRDSAIEEGAAARLIRTGSTYARLCAAFVPWSRGMLNASIDVVNQRITFSLKQQPDSTFYEQQLLADLNWWVQEHAKWPLAAAEKIFRSWYQGVSGSRQGLFFDLGSVPRHPAFSAFRDWAAQVVLPELAEATSFGSYSLKELRTFLAAIHAVSDCICELELRMDETVGRSNPMGSWVLEVPAGEVGRTFSVMTSLPPATCDAICSDLCFNRRSFHATVSATPFVVSRARTLFLSPWNVRNCVPQRSAIAALTRGSARGRYDVVSKAVEQHHLALIAKEIQSLGYRAVVEKRIRLSGTEINPDILVFDQDGALTTLIEFKNSLAATSAGEVMDTSRYRMSFPAAQTLRRVHDTSRVGHPT